MRSIDGLGAYRAELRNLTVGNTPPVLIRTAALTASAFHTARVAPLIGRGLLDADETPGSAGIVVLGYACGSARSRGETMSWAPR